MDKKEAPIKEVSAETVPELFLKESHMMRIELGSEKQKNVQSELKEINLTVQLLQREIELISAQIKVKEAFIRDLQRMVPERKKKYSDLRLEDKEYLEEVKKELGITADKWGYDPDTGEVKLEENT